LFGSGDLKNLTKRKIQKKLNHKRDAHKAIDNSKETPTHARNNYFQSKNNYSANLTPAKGFFIEIFIQCS
jgi:hypothetical protein